MIRRLAGTYASGTQYRRTLLSTEEKAWGGTNLASFVAQVLVARGQLRMSAATPDQVELFRGVARRVSDLRQRPVFSHANGREIVITFGQQEAPPLALRSPGWSFPRTLIPGTGSAAKHLRDGRIDDDEGRQLLRIIRGPCR